MKGWRELNRIMNLLTEKDVQNLLDEELANARRVQYLIRYHQRVSAMRVSRERIELLQEAMK